MNKTLTRLFTVALLMMVSMGARAEVKVLFGENGTEKYEGKGGTIQVKQEESRDGGKVTVRLAFIPEKNYTFDEQSLEVYKVFSPESATARALEIDGDALKLEEDKSTNPSEKHYHVDIDSKLALWVKVANFTNMRKSGDPITVTYHIINLGRLDDSGQLTTDNRTEALQFTVTGENLTVGVPDKYKSPLAKNWVYYSSNDVTYDTTNKKCTFNAGPSLSESDALNDGADVYVAYELDEDAFSTIGMNDGGIYRIKFNSNYYLQQSTWYNSTTKITEINTTSTNVINPTSFEYLWKFNIVDPYQITIQSQSSDYTNYYLSNKTGNTDFADIRLQQTLSAAQGTKAWAFSLLPGGTDGTYRLIVTDGSVVSPNNTNKLDNFGHGYLNNNRTGNKTTYHLYNQTAYDRCDLTIESLNATYTYNIVDTQGHIAIKYTVSQPMGSQLRTYEAIPAAIRSPYIEGETVTFYSTFSESSRSNLSGEITNTPITGGDIYVAYTTDQLTDKPLHLRGQRGFQMQVNGEYVYDNSGTLSNTSSTDDIEDNYKWKFSGLDPYRVRIQNVSTGSYLNWSISPSASLSLDARSNSFFILFGGNVVRPDGVPAGQTDQVELMAASGADISSNPYYNVGRASGVGLLASSDNYGHKNAAVQVLLKADEHTKIFYIIDKSGHIVIEESGNFQDLVVPAKWQSPLVSHYHFYTLEDFTVSGGVYTLNGTPTEISSILDAPSNIYVTYDISDAYDLDGSEQRAVDGKKYLLKFAGGTKFHQEKSDGFEATEDEGIYPYINGEGGLFVYGKDKLKAQAEEAATTRTRWVWYLEGGDPYRLRISSLQTRTDGTTDDTRYSYLRTYKPQGYSEVVTGVISNNPEVYDASDDAHAVRHKPTDYMILKGTGTHFRLVTSDVVDDLDGDDTNDVRHTVTSFENYWKTNPTAANVIHDNDNTFTVGNTPSDAQITAALTTGTGAKGWHSYNVWANGSTWTNSKKVFGYGEHWFQTINVGTEMGGVFNGDFDLVEYELDGALILLDQHGWEIMRKPITNRAIDKAAYGAAIKKYDSPMVKKYHFWTNFTYESGYHKYKPIRGESNESKNAQHKGEGTSLANYPEVFSTGTLADIYVTYEVMATYRNRYNGAATEAGTIDLPCLIRQGTNYAKTTDGENISTVSAASVTDLSSVDDELLWKVKPNFNIDTEMGYHYDGNDNIYDEKTQAETESDYYNNDDPTVYDTTNGQNGFDPYNLQIESVKYPGKLFTTNATDAVRDGSGGMRSTYGETKTVTLQDYGQAFIASDYYNIDVETHTGYQMLHVTNSTFMAVSDGNGNIRLMPRFDHHNVQTSLTTLDEQQAAAIAGDNGASTQTTLFVPPMTTAEITSSEQIIDLNGTYILAENFEITRVVGTADNPFTGTIDGQLHTINGVDLPLIGYAQDATIKNVILDNVHISEGTTVNVGGVDKVATGAIANVATGTTRIYNCGVLASNSEVTTDKDGYTQIISCSSSVSGSGSDYVGGLVGYLDGEARVINCFSYTNITGGNEVGGIVGRNNIATTSSNLKTMVMNCMFYGDITGGTSKAPVYNGEIITNVSTGSGAKNKGVSNFNYFWGDASYVHNRHIDKYNCALMAETRFLQRFEFFRHLLNSHRELAAWWASTTSNTVNSTEIAKWVLEPSQIGTSTPYPILETPRYYPSVVNIDADHATTQTERNKGGLLGTLTVNIQMGDGKVYTHPGTGENEAKITTSELTLNITDKDPDHFNFNYYKVQLPYYNDVGTKNYTGDRVVTGWKIVNITVNGTTTTTGTGGWSTSDDATATINEEGEITLTTPYNFADRGSTKKDLYGVSGRVFNQGAYWDVPEGVTAITIEPYWAKAVYLADAYADVVYSTDMKTAYNVPTVGGGQKYTNGVENQFNGQKVYTTLTGTGGAIDSNVLGAQTTHSVYDNAVVLVGNFHHYGDIEADIKPYTVTTVDFDGDDEPDYSFILRFDGRNVLHPVRYDFLNLVGLGMAQKSTGGTGTYNFGILVPKGWFESTNTSLFQFTQFEYEHSSRTVNDPLILQGGVMEQWVSFNQNGISQKIPYYHVGGNVWFKEFHRGCHQDRKQNTKHPPISVTGGDFKEFYLTGLYRADFDNYEDNLECYINGGRFGIVAGAAQEGAGKASDHTKGNVVWQIQNADIDEFYGGGLNAVHPVEGNITTVITGGYIKQFCGGPKFGDMNTGKTVMTTAANCKFDTFFGAGYGGNSYSRFTPSNINNIGGDYGESSWNTWLNNNYKQEYSGTYKGVSTTFTTQYIPMSNNYQNVARLLIDYVSFSLATTHSVTSNLTGCTITRNFYGGGSLGKVEGPVTSTLDNCIVNGNVFGAGFSASLPTVDVMNTGGFIKAPYFDSNLGVYMDPIYPATVEYNWQQRTDGKTVNSTALAIDKTNHILYTNINLDKSNLGSVAGAVSLTLKGNTKVGSMVSTLNEETSETVTTLVGGNVFGGGESSYVTGAGNKVTVNLEGNTEVLGNVYGGGDKGDVQCSTEVNIRQTAPTTTDPEP